MAVIFANIISVIALNSFYTPPQKPWGFIISCFLEWVVYIAILRKTNKKLELLSVCFLINVVSYFCISVKTTDFENRRFPADEEYAISRLVDLAVAQRDFKKDARVDQDNDKEGEYGLLNEIIGAVKLRCAGGISTDPIKIADLTNSYVVTKGNYGQISYHIQVYLPGSVTDHEKKAQMGSKNSEVIDAQEKYWIAYAWPKKPWYGRYCFVINHRGEVFYTENKKSGEMMYVGDKRPAYNAAMDKERNNVEWGEIADGKKAVDGQTWISIGNLDKKKDLTFSLLLATSILGLIALIILKLGASQ